MAEFDNLIKIWACLLDQLQRRRFQHLMRLNMDVAVGNHS
jgi:hypothetical protein